MPFGRRPFRRSPLGPGRLPRPPLLRPGLHVPPVHVVPAVVRQALMEADRLAKGGAFAEACAIYRRLADEAYAHQRPLAGAQMDLEATRAYLGADTPGEASHHGIRALETLLRAGRNPRSALALLDQLVAALEMAGDGAEADRLRGEAERVAAAYGYRDSHVTQTPPQPQRRLPAQCPSCCAPLRPDEVERLDEDRVQCSYCGNIVLET